MGSWHNNGHMAIQYGRKCIEFRAGRHSWSSDILTLGLVWIEKILQVREIINIANEGNLPKNIWLSFSLHAFSCSQISVVGKWFRLLCYKKEVGFLFILYFPIPPPTRIWIWDFTLPGGRQSKYLYKNNQNNDSQTRCKDLRWLPCFENFQGIMLNHMLKGEEESVCSWRTSTLSWHTVTGARLDSK